MEDEAFCWMQRLICVFYMGYIVWEKKFNRKKRNVWIVHSLTLKLWLMHFGNYFCQNLLIGWKSLRKWDSIYWFRICNLFSLPCNRYRNISKTTLKRAGIFRNLKTFSSWFTWLTLYLSHNQLKWFLCIDCRNLVHFYDLYSCIAHYGQAGSAGHYITYCLNGLNQQWYEFHDEHVRQPRSKSYGRIRWYPLQFPWIPEAGFQSRILVPVPVYLPLVPQIRNREPDTIIVSNRFRLPVPMIPSAKSDTNHILSFPTESYCRSQSNISEKIHYTSYTLQSHTITSILIRYFPHCSAATAYGFPTYSMKIFIGSPFRKAMNNNYQHIPKKIKSRESPTYNVISNTVRHPRGNRMTYISKNIDKYK